METLLKIDNGILPPWTGRRCTQKIMPIPGNEPQRTVNGELVDMNPQRLNKVRTLITGQDRDAPFLDALRLGQGISISSIAGLFLWCPPGQNRVDLNRLPVEGSMAVMTRQKALIRAFRVYGSTVEFPHEHNGLWVRYRPILHTRVVDFSLERDEKTFQTSWTLLLEEV